MKRNMMCYLLLALLGISSACQDELEADRTTPDGKEPVHFYKDKVRFDEAERLRSESYSSLFSVDHVRRIEDTLIVEVSYAKGCKGTFDVIWDGAIMESYPMQARLFLKFNATGCPKDFSTEDIVKKIITIDLIGFIGNEKLVEETIFHVSNASSLQDVSCEGDCDKSVVKG